MSASGYTNTRPRDEGDFYWENRFGWSSTYNASTNTSTITFRLQIYSTINLGNDVRMWDPGNPDRGGGIYRDGSLIYTFGSNYGSGNYLRTWSNPYNDWVGLFPQGDDFPTITVQHNSSGDASVVLGLRGQCINMYDYDQGYTSWIRTDNGFFINIHENAPYAISYNANGGSGAPSSTAIYAGVSYSLSTTRPTRTGYNFLGWSTSSSATSASYSPGQSVTPNGNLALYAVWQKQSFTLSISQGTGSTISVKRNGSTLSNGSTIYYGDVLAISISANTGYNIGTHTVNGSNWTSGNYTVTSAVSVISTASLIQYTLSITTSAAGVTVNVDRTSSPIAGAFIGTITNGAVLYYNDVIEISYTVGGAYQLLTATVNNVDISGETLPYSVTVNQNIVVSVTVKLGAIVYIGNEAYQAFIGDGTNWIQCQAFIGNGSEWETY